MSRRPLAGLLLCGAILAAAGARATSAESADAAQAAIRSALLTWTMAFNARDTSHVCDLFAPGLRYDYQGLPERDYDALCTLLRKSLADRTKALTYSPAIKEIIVSGDLAVVRLTWTLKVTRPAPADTAVSREVGLDVFGKQPDGSWKIVRYIAYDEKP